VRSPGARPRPPLASAGIDATDTPSPLAAHYAGCAGGPSLPFGVDHNPFAVESATLKFTEPELLVARGMALDYFASVRAAVPPARLLFTWESAAHFGGAELLLVGQLCSQLGLPTSAAEAEAALPAGALPSAALASAAGLPADWRAAYLTGELPELVELFPELAAFRDLIFLFKLLMCPEQSMLPPRARWRPSDAHLTWAHRIDASQASRPPHQQRSTLVVLGFGLRHNTTTPLNLGLTRALQVTAVAFEADLPISRSPACMPMCDL
jgi:hypothetical protein